MTKPSNVTIGLSTMQREIHALLAAYGRNPLSFEVYLRFIAPRIRAFKWIVQFRDHRQEQRAVFQH